ncbi:hypothetical protein ONS96_007230 [Cadophora gregata f. sp. sojae]|nr:hypothetical protein ONS96_007230 [Cadophora gregata f. sp. sojae]
MATNRPGSSGFADDFSEATKSAHVDSMDFSRLNTSEYPDPDSAFSKNPYPYRKSDRQSPIPEALVEAFAFGSDNPTADSSESIEAEDDISVDVTHEKKFRLEEDPMYDMEYSDSNTAAELAVETEDNSGDLRGAIKPNYRFSSWTKGLYAHIDQQYFRYLDGAGAVEQPPPMIGSHVRYPFSYGRYLEQRRTPFVAFEVTHLVLQPLNGKEVSEMRKHGINVSRARVSWGEWQLVRDKRLNAHRCIPSSLRKAWSME